MSVIERIVGYTDELVAIRRDLHAHPELGFEEVRTSGIVAELLASWGIAVHRGIGVTGVVGVLDGKRAAPDGAVSRSIGLRADMDALPMEEHTNLFYASKVPGKFHGCGHDVHTTMLLGAARYLAETRDFSGRVVFIFQPAEEGLGGARAMLADGLFDRFPCDEIYGMHNYSAEAPGTVTIKPGAAMAGADFFDIHIQGSGSHAAMPERSRDPLIAATQLVQALQTIISRNLSALQQAVLSVTKINAGSAYNVVPDAATLGGTLRYFDEAVAEVVRGRVAEIARGIEAMFGVTVTVEFRKVFSPLHNDETLTDAYVAVARGVVGADNVRLLEKPFMGSEDFADMLLVRPGAYCMVGHAGTVPAHNPKFVVDEGIIPVGASIYARMVESRLA
ncbi:M20 aminoacylase family protein [Devosia sp. A449]